MKNKLHGHGKKKLHGESAEGQATSSQPTDYVFGSVSGSLFPREASSSSGLLSSLFTSAPAVNNQLYVPAPKPVPKSQPKDEDDVKIKAPTNQKEKKNAKKKSAADEQVESRESALQNADDQEQVATKTPKKTKRKAVAVGEGDEEKEEGPRKRMRTAVEHAEERIKMKRTVFVGNLPVSANKKTLKLLFQGKGPIESMRFRSVIREDPGMSRKVAAIQRKVHAKVPSINAYVVFKHEEGAAKALEMNGTEVEKNFHVRVDKVSQNSTHDHKRSIFVGNLPFDITELPVRKHFEECGPLESVRLIRDKNSGLGKGFGYILFESADSVQLALKLDGSKLQGRSVRVKRSVTKEKAAKMAPKRGPQRNRDKGPNKGTGTEGQETTGPGRERGPNKGGRETTGPARERGPNKQGFKGRPGQGPQNKFTGKPFGKNPNKSPSSSSSFKGEMADPTKKPKNKGLKKKLKPRKRDQVVHL